ncbi:hypothetical protein B7463_g7484, partial [Scytalidium lignicola]
MVEADAIVHVVEILGVFLCAHHFWPKGILYGEHEDWELKHAKKQHKSPKNINRSQSRDHGHSHRQYGSSDSGSGSRSNRSTSVSGHRKRRQGFYDDYYETPRSTNGYGHSYDYDNHDHAVDDRQHYYERDYRRDRSEVGQGRKRYDYSDDGSRGSHYSTYDDDDGQRMRYLEYHDGGRSQTYSDDYQEPRRHSRRASSRY